MRLFQNAGIYPAYFPRLNSLTQGAGTFAEHIRRFLADRWGASHLLLPVLEGQSDAFFTNADDPVGQGLWARENGLPRTAGPDEILLAQIEAHRTEVFYNLDPVRFGAAFLKRLPGSVRRRIAWRAAPSPGADFRGYDLMVCNFPSILASFEAQGLKTAWFAPAHDPVLDSFAANAERPIDILFVGGYSRHHKRRAELLTKIAGLDGEMRVAMHLDCSRLTRLADSPLGWMPPLSAHRRPAALRRIARPPIFGLELYRALSQSKIVINAAIDMAGTERGNMRCFEAMGAGCLLLTDEGLYPDGMAAGQTIVTFSTPNDAVNESRALLAERDRLKHVAENGHNLVRNHYSKDRQWAQFLGLVEHDRQKK